MPVKFKNVLDAFQLADMRGAGEQCVYLCRQSGKLHWDLDQSYSALLGEEDEEDELPEDIDDEEKYVQLPGRRELGLGKPLALDFAREFLPGDFDYVRQIFSKRGAYPRFHDLLIRRNVRDGWHAFQAQAEERALREWCESNEIEVGD